jgi:hypothetical protein
MLHSHGEELFDPNVLLKNGRLVLGAAGGLEISALTPRGREAAGRLL